MSAELARAIARDHKVDECTDIPCYLCDLLYELEHGPALRLEEAMHAELRRNTEQLLKPRICYPTPVEQVKQYGTVFVWIFVLLVVMASLAAAGMGTGAR